MTKLAGKSAIVTGAGSGIGAAAAMAMAAEGARVLVADVDGDAARRTAGTISSSGGTAIGETADVSRHDDVDGMVSSAVSAFGRIDILFNNAGIQLHKSLEETAEDEWDRLFAVNVRGMFLCSKAVLGPMRDARGGVILNCASVASFRALMGRDTAYVASKGAVMGLTRDLAIAVARDNIRVLAICPGPVRTEILAESIRRGVVDEQSVRALQLTDRIAEPGEIGAIAAYLVSDEARYFVGAGVVADGGMCIV